MKTKEQTELINRERARAMILLERARIIFTETECGLGADTIAECITEILRLGMDEY